MQQIASKKLNLATDCYEQIDGYIIELDKAYSKFAQNIGTSQGLLSNSFHSTVYFQEQLTKGIPTRYQVRVEKRSHVFTEHLKQTLTIIWVCFLFRIK
jgi:hypothetical protein